MTSNFLEANSAFVVIVPNPARRLQVIKSSGVSDIVSVYIFYIPSLLLLGIAPRDKASHKRAVRAENYKGCKYNTV